MNIHKYQKNISDFLLTGRRVSEGTNRKSKTHNAGVYIISRTVDDSLMKLGEAKGQGGLYDRIIKQYKVCYSLKSSEFFLRYLFICPKKKDGKTHYSQILEKKLLKDIDGEVEDSYSKEYIFNTNTKNLEGKMIQTLKSNKDIYETAIKFEKDGFRIFDEEKGFDTPLQNFNNLPSLNSDVNNLLSLSNPEIRDKPQPTTRPQPAPIQTGTRKSSRLIKSTANTKYKDFVIPMGR